MDESQIKEFGRRSILEHGGNMNKYVSGIRPGSDHFEIKSFDNRIIRCIKVSEQFKLRIKIMFLKEYTGAEVENLTDEQVQKIINFECADAGAPMLPVRPEEPIRPNHKPDMQLYQVGGYYGWYVKTAEQAANILEILGSIELWDTEYAGNSYDNKRAKRKDFDVAGKVEASNVFSPELWDRIKSEMEIYNQNKKNYDKNLADYNAAYKERNNISEWVWEIISDARQFKRKREELLQFKQSYLELADNNIELGDKFFLKAYPAANSYLNKFFEHENVKANDNR